MTSGVVSSGRPDMTKDGSCLFLLDMLNRLFEVASWPLDEVRFPTNITYEAPTRIDSNDPKHLPGSSVFPKNPTATSDPRLPLLLVRDWRVTPSRSPFRTLSTRKMTWVAAGSLLLFPDREEERRRFARPSKTATGRTVLEETSPNSDPQFQAPTSPTTDTRSKS